MKKYICTICGYVYDEAIGDPERGIAPGTKWEDLPEDWTCPLCGATKSEFNEEPTNKPVEKPVAFFDEEDIEHMHELSFGELSALCSNLAKGCEKQYRTEEAALFEKLSGYYKSKAKPLEGSSFDNLITLVQQDINTGYPKARQASSGQGDRGALRALTWNEKVSKILNSLLLRYENQKKSLLENTHVYVCEICGFIYIGDEAPDICPVCKVPKLKIAQVKRG